MGDCREWELLWGLLNPEKAVLVISSATTRGLVPDVQQGGLEKTYGHCKVIALTVEECFGLLGNLLSFVRWICMFGSWVSSSHNRPTDLRSDRSLLSSSPPDSLAVTLCFYCDIFMIHPRYVHWTKWGCSHGWKRVQNPVKHLEEFGLDSDKTIRGGEFRSSK